MKCVVVLLSLSVLVAAQLELATDCEEELCQLPACRCSSTNIPGRLRPRDTPQVSDMRMNILNAAIVLDIIPHHHE